MTIQSILNRKGSDVITIRPSATVKAAADQMREHGIALGSPDTEPAQPPTAPKLIADELGKLAQLRDSGVLSQEEFVALKTQLIQGHTA